MHNSGILDRVEAENVSGRIYALLLSCGLNDATIRDWARRASARKLALLDLLLVEGVLAETLLLTQLAKRIGAQLSHTPPPPAKAENAAELFRFRSYGAQSEVGEVRVVAPNARQIGLLLERFDEGGAVSIILTTRQALLDALVRADAPNIVQRASATLPAQFSARAAKDKPEEGERNRGRWLFRLSFAGLFCLLVGGWAFYDLSSLIILPPLLLAPVFLLATISLLTATIESTARVTPPPTLAENVLPRYSVLVPLYRETEVMDVLIARLDALDYPRDKLDILLLLEEDDAATIAALAALSLPPCFLRLIVPAGEPRTKPRALNAGLDFASGDLLVVYDAEDAPESTQLKRAAALFAHHDARIACLQGRLVISNAGDGFLTRRFAIEYAALFDCVKSGAARLGWPVLLGGSSNHFRLPILRRIGGWDAWNVTEDADLGLRLARFGYQVGDLPSSTFEEAPNTLSSWLNQRTRWLKGWMQTLSVHARAPRLLLQQLGGFHTLVTASTGIAVLLGALLYPLFFGALIWRLASDLPFGAGAFLNGLADSMILLLLAFTLAVEIAPAVLALKRRRALRLVPLILFAPISYLLVSIAAWRGLSEWVRAPYYWHKTTHGLAKKHSGPSGLGD